MLFTLHRVRRRDGALRIMDIFVIMVAVRERKREKDTHIARKSRVGIGELHDDNEEFQQQLTQAQGPHISPQIRDNFDEITFDTTN